jgi:GTP cyclohydrolase IA
VVSVPVEPGSDSLPRDDGRSSRPPSPRGAGRSQDSAAVERAVLDLLKALGEDPEREGLAETPRRVAEMFREVLGGLHEDPSSLLDVTLDERHEEMIVLRDITFHSLCEHHLLPFSGVVHVAYIPRGRVVGISRLARLVDCLARRLQLQERLTSQIADLIEERLRPRGVAVVVKAEHLCMTMRGIKKPGSWVVTSATRGGFRDRQATRMEFLALLDGRER